MRENKDISEKITNAQINIILARDFRNKIYSEIKKSR